MRPFAHALVLGLAFATSALAAPDALSILKRADAILAPAEYEADAQLITRRPDGEKREFDVHLWKKGTTRFRVKFKAPAEDRGSEVLRDGDNMWSYLPNLKRSLKISPKQEFHGGDFNNTDILRVNLAEDYVPTLAAASDPAEYLLELRAKDDTVSYDLVKYWIRKKDFMPLRQEFYTKSGKLIRKLDLQEPRAFSGHVRPSRLVMVNTLMPGRQTEMVYQRFDLKGSLDEGVFQLAVLGR